MILYYDYFEGEVSGFTETKLKSILTTIEACSNATSLCSISVGDLTAAKERFQRFLTAISYYLTKSDF